MNSAIQCLFHTQILKDQFLKNKINFEKEINKNNPLGSKGCILMAFKDLIYEYYHTLGTKIVPRQFKNIV